MEPNNEAASAPPDPDISQTPTNNQNDNASGSVPPPFTPPQPAGPEQPAAPPAQPSATGGVVQPASQQPFTPANPVISETSSGGFPKKLLIPVIVVIVLLIGAAAFYFGYYNNPSVIYAQSLSNTGKGYDKLIDYADKQSGMYDKGLTGSGTYKLSTQGFSTDGKVDYQGDGINSDLKFDVGISGSRVNAEVRAIKGSGTTPDIYIKASGIKGLGASLGSPEFNALLAKLDGNWIVMDHTILDSLGSVSQTDSGSTTTPTREQILDEARAFGQVNQQYLFSTDKDKAVTEVVKKVGKETVDGHSTYHYKIALNKDNVKKYIRAQEDALKSSKLNDWVKKNDYQKSVNDAFGQYLKSADDIKSSDTYDLWADTGQRIVYKIRYAAQDNPASNYVDLGLNYKGGDDFPFFMQGKSKDGDQTTTYSLAADVNTATNKTGLKLSYKVDGSDGGNFDGDFSFQPSNSQIKVEKPAKAMTVNQVLSYLGLGSNPSSDGALLTTGGPASSSRSAQLNDQLQAGGTSSGAYGTSAPAARPWVDLLKQVL